MTLAIFRPRLMSLLALGCLAVGSAWAKPRATVLDLNKFATDSAIVLPESFETDTHRMLENWYLQNYTALDADVASRPDAKVSDEEIIKRLGSIPTTVELPFNSIVRAYIDAYTGKNRALVENMLGMSLYYLPIFEQALEREQLPMELKYLPVIESAMNPDAVSRSGATGLWQLMLPTARGFGMEVNTLVDERRDPVASSAVAARLLRQLYDIYHDWSLTIAAYNCGPGNINKALRRCTADKKDFWAIYPYLPKQTRGYVPCFIAATYVMNFYKEHNISPALAKKPILTDSVHVGRRVHFQQISDILQIPVEELRVLNPQYRQDLVPGDIRPYSLVLPANQVYAYIMSEDAICAHNADLYARRDTAEPATGAVEGEEEAVPATVDGQEGEWVTTEKVLWHKVKKGETLSSIARRYGVSLTSLRKANGNISKARRGRTLKVVTVEKTFKPSAPVAAPDATPGVTPPEGGDNLLVKQDTAPAAPVQDDPAAADGSAADMARADAAAEAAMAGPVETPAKAVAPAAPAKDSAADDKAPAASKKDTASASKKDKAASKKDKAADKKKADAKKKKKDTSKTVTVRNGDSLDKIARKNGTTVAKIKQLNGLKGNNPVIQPGQKLRVK